MQIFTTPSDSPMETISHTADAPDLDLQAAKEIAKKIARSTCKSPMILSWKNGITGEFYPTFECGKNEKPPWIHYAEARGANLTIDINDGAFIFMILKM